jgi:hypothetical protein
VIDDLAVTRAQGGTAHHITPEQWHRLLEEAGLAQWPSGDSPEVDAIEEEVRRLVRQPGRRQGFGLSADQRAAVERRAMQVVSEHFIECGWTVEDVSGTSPYDLRCTRKTGELRRVEVKGTTGGAAAVIVTYNEVIAAKADPSTAVLAVVHGIALENGGRTARGGTLHLISPWHPHDRALMPIAYRYLIPSS